MGGGNTLITGPPGCGKSHLVESALDLMERPATGFFTREVRERGRRTGFSIITLDGKKGVLAGIHRKGPRVGRYGVNLKDVDEIAVPSMVPSDGNTLVVIDEIGKMECLSGRFRETLARALDSINPVLGSIALKGNRFIEGIKVRGDVDFIHVTEINRDSLVQEIVRRIGRA